MVTLMSEVLLSENSREKSVMQQTVKRPVRILGVPLCYGADMAGVELGPAVLRGAGINQRIARLGYGGRGLGGIGAGHAQTAGGPHDRTKELPGNRGGRGRLGNWGYKGFGARGISN